RPSGSRLPPLQIKLPAGPPAPRRYAPVGGASVTPEGNPRPVHATHQDTALPVRPVGPLERGALKLLGLGRHDVVARRLRVGAHLVAGTILGVVGTAGRIGFAVRPAGRGAPRVDPKPILDGWRLLEATATDRAAGRDPLLAIAPSGGALLGVGRAALGRRVLADPRIQIYACGRHDIAQGLIDPRVLATLEFLAGNGLDPTVTSLHCGHSRLTASGNVSEHSTGDAVDLAAINGTPILGHQGAGSIADLTIRRLLTLSGAMKPHQIISLMTFPGADNALALPDHYDHIHIGFTPQGTPNGVPTGEDVLAPATWTHLIDQLARLPNPPVRLHPSRYSVTVPRD
ncbi:MAG: peptidoglycan DD-metalloendopeptidase family protein, partial [Solirubrobacterales bacterium]|nr:peptidoglycan DD-metalloendopeptidase family protein [Solirubrobacterales bacterium]